MKIIINLVKNKISQLCLGTFKISLTKNNSLWEVPLGQNFIGSLYDSYFIPVEK